MKINKNSDIGYIFKGNNFLPIRPLEVNQDLIKDPNYQVKHGTKLFIHGEILKYYLATNTIKVSDNLQKYERSYLYAALNDLGFSIILRANHKMIVFLGNHVSKGIYQNMTNVINTLDEPITGIGNLSIGDNGINSEQFPNIKTGIKILNTRYKQEKEQKTR